MEIFLIFSFFFFFFKSDDLAILSLYFHLVLVRPCIVTSVFIHTHTCIHMCMYTGASVPLLLCCSSGELRFMLALVGIWVVTQPYMMKYLWDFYSFDVSWFFQKNWKRGGNNTNQITLKVFLSLMHKLTDLCEAQLKRQDKTVRKFFCFTASLYVPCVWLLAGN